MEESAERVSTESLSQDISGLWVLFRISQKETKAVTGGHRESSAFPLVHGAVETKEVLHSHSIGKVLNATGTVKINQENLMIGDEKISQLKIRMKEP
jgi:hypothetical protein